MARDIYNDTIIDVSVAGAPTVLISGVFVHVTLTSDDTDATIFQDRTGGVELANPFEAVDGIARFWADDGEYDVSYHDTMSRIGDVTIGWEALSAADGSLSGAILTDNTVDGVKLVDSSVTTSKIDDAAVTSDKLAVASVLEKLGLDSSGVVRRGKSIIAAAGTRTNAAYGALSNGPDQVASVELPAGGLIVVSCQAIWQESVAGTARAAIFLGANQLKVPLKQGPVNRPVTQAAMTGSSDPANFDAQLLASMIGLISNPTFISTSATAYSGDVTTGQALGAVLGASGDVTAQIELDGAAYPLQFDPGSTTSYGGLCLVDADPGTYDISVQFKASSGTVTVKNRKLRVWTIGF